MPRKSVGATGDVDDGQAPVTEAGAAAEEEPLSVRAAVSDQPRRRAELVEDDRLFPSRVHPPHDSAHVPSQLLAHPTQRVCSKLGIGPAQGKLLLLLGLRMRRRFLPWNLGLEGTCEEGSAAYC